MNTPTTCMSCFGVFPIDVMRRDSEGNWYCSTCRHDMLASAADGLRSPPGVTHGVITDASYWKHVDKIRAAKKEAQDPGFVADVMAGDNEEAKNLLRLLGVAEMSEVCQHAWEGGVFVNGVEKFICQNCGAQR